MIYCIYSQVQTETSNHMTDINALTDKFWNSSKQVSNLIKKVAKNRCQKSTDKLVKLGWTIDEIQVIIELFY